MSQLFMEKCNAVKTQVDGLNKCHEAVSTLAHTFKVRAQDEKNRVLTLE